MKIILTEAQINTLTQIEQASDILSESIFKPNRLNKMKTLVKRMLYGGIAAASVIAAINKQNIPEEEKEVLTQIVLNNSVEDSIENTKEEPIKDTNDNHYQDMVKAVEEYMIYALKNQGYTSKEIAKSLKKDPKAVYNAYHRIKKKIKEISQKTE